MKYVSVVVSAAVAALTGICRAAETPQVADFDPNMALAHAVVTNGVKWIDGAYLPLEGRAFGDLDRPYDRLPRAAVTNVNPGVGFLLHHSAGMQFRFATDSKRLAVKWTPLFGELSMDHMPATGVSGVDVYAREPDGRWRYVKTGRIVDAKGASFEIAWTPGTPCLVNLPLYNGIGSIAVGIDPEAKVEALPPRASGVNRPVVFYGTSITHGGCASRPGLAFPSIVGRRLDVPIVNLGFSGSGRGELQMSDYLAEIDASCYVIDCVWNMDPEMLRERYEKFVRNLRAKRPSTPIVLAEACDVFCGGELGKDAQDRNAVIREIHARFASEGWKDLHYLPAEGQYADDFEGTVDGVHPNDWGMMHLADAFGAAVAKALRLVRPRDVTDKLENLGIPLAADYPDAAFGGCGAYARNVWALQPYDGRLFIGCGNSANGGPAANAGPVPVVAYDPVRGVFEREWTAPDEQIDVFRVLADGRLCVPGHDPREDWSFGNFYRRAAGSAAWEKVRTLPKGIHVYDMAEFDGALCACGFGTYESADGGRTFVHADGPRYYAFLRFPQSLYAAGDASQCRKGMLAKATDSNDGVRARPMLARKRRARAFEQPVAASPARLYPSTPEATNAVLRVARPSALGDRVVYIGGIVHNDHQFWPVGLYTATDGEEGPQAERVPLPAGARPWCTVREGDDVYVLFSLKDADGVRTVNHVWVSRDARTFVPWLSFRADTFARAMAFLDGSVYFGLGTEIADHGRFADNRLDVKFGPDELCRASGTLLRCRAQPAFHE